MSRTIGIGLALAASLFLAGCGEQSAQRAVEAMGFGSVSLSSTPVLWGCGHDDNIFYNQRFTALGAKGQPVSGVVCGSLFKGYTVRID